MSGNRHASDAGWNTNDEPVRGFQTLEGIVVNADQPYWNVIGMPIRDVIANLAVQGISLELVWPGPERE